MKKLKFVVLLAVLMTVGVGKSYAHDIEVANADGVTIYYNFINNRTELEVTYPGSSSSNAVYFGKVVIPESVTYEGNTYSVTSIGLSAFYNCNGLTEVTIPSSVTSVSLGLFSGCSGLEKITVESGNPIFDSRENCNAIIHTNSNGLIIGCKNTIIPNSVTSIGQAAFESCSGLTELTIPSSVTSIDINPFSGCDGLEKITVESGNPNYDSRENCNAIINTNTNELITGCKNTIIPNSVISIGDKAFSGCSGLIELTIPNSVTSIGWYAFYDCSSLTELTIGNSVTSIVNRAFQGCSSLTELTIPNSVITIGDYAFSGCSGLTELTIGNSVTSIGDYAFTYCYALRTIYSLNTTPPSVANTNVFNISYYGDLYATADLFVPEKALAAYQTAEVWKKFQKLQGLEGLGDEAEKCATPTIHYANNKLTFKCETEGVTYESTITDTDIASYSNDEIDLSVTYTVTVYATKEGYANSDITTATLCWIDVEPKTDGTTDDNTAVQQISATPVLIQSANSQITVTGLTDGTTVAVYNLSGQQVGTVTSMGGQASISTGMTAGAAAIVKIGDSKSVKVAVK